MKALFTYVLIIATLLYLHQTNKRIDQFIEITEASIIDPIDLAPPSIQTYEYFMEAAERYDVPKKIARGILRKETGFKDPLNLKYNPHQTSSAKAYGPGQVQLPTGKYILDDKSITKDDLLYNLKLNADASMKYIRYLYDRYGSWAVALGYYNTGYPVVNDYALSIVNGV